jgi:hypothetical protein
MIGRFAGWWMNDLRCQFLRELVLVVIEKLPGGITETGRVPSGVFSLKGLDLPGGGSSSEVPASGRLCSAGD